MNREQLDNWCQKGILALVLAILVFGPLAMGGVDARDMVKGIPYSRSWQFLVLETLTLLVMLLWMARWWLVERPQLLWPPVCWAVLAFVTYAIIRYSQADVEYVARQELIRILIYAFLFFAVLNNLHGQEHTKFVALTLIFLGMLISFYAGWQFVTKSNRVWNLISPYEGRAGGTFIYPNSLAAFLEMLVPIGLCFAFMGRLSHVTKIIVGYATLVMLGGIAVTLSRGGALVTGIILVTLCAVLLMQRQYRLQGAILLIALVVAGWILIPQARMAQQRFQSAMSSGRADDMRLPLWRAAFRMWQDHPAWGVGPAQFDTRFAEYRPADVQRRPGWVHNDYLNTLTDWGVVGAVIVASAFLLIFFGVMKSWKPIQGPPDDFARRKSNKLAFLVGASLGLFAILLHSAIDFNLHIPAIAILAMTLMALLSSQTRFATERYWWRLGAGSRGVATIVVLLGVGYLGWLGTRATQEWYWLQIRAEQTPNFSYARIAALEQAHRAEPMNPETTYAIGHSYQIKAFGSESNDPDALARKAIEWYQRGMKLNPHDGYNWLSWGMCLDRIGSAVDPRPDTSRYYRRAEELDPNGYYTAANVGWHYFETGDYAAARSWLERSRRLEWKDNEIATDLMPLVERRLKEDAERNR